MIPFRGRLGFRQYLPGKRFLYGVKMFKICAAGGYTWKVKIYGGKEVVGRDETLATVLELMNPQLRTNRTLYTDNYYTSVTLANHLTEKKTHLAF